MHVARRLSTTLHSYKPPLSLIRPTITRLQSPRPLNILRTMSSSAETQNEWLVILPDKTDAQAVERRLQVRSKHLEGAMARGETGQLNFGGIMLHEHLKEGETPKFKGSIMMLQVETREEVLDIIKSDKYVENDVWDLEKVEIYPFRTALRKAL